MDYQTITSELLLKFSAFTGAFLLGAIFLMYRAFVKNMGKRVAELATATDITNIEEKVKQGFRIQLQDYKTKVNTELATELEPIKSELAKGNIAYQIQYSHLHQKRGEVIIELYQKLIELHSAMVEWTRTFQPIVEDAEAEKAERESRANKAIHDFKNYYLFHKVYFSKNFCFSIDELFKEYWDKGWDFGWKSGRIASGQITQEDYLNYSKELNKISTEIKEVLPSRIEELENQIRGILGVDEEFPKKM